MMSIYENALSNVVYIGMGKYTLNRLDDILSEQKIQRMYYYCKKVLILKSILRI